MKNLKEVANYLNKKYNLNLKKDQVDGTEIYCNGASGINQIGENDYIIECHNINKFEGINVVGTAKVIDGKLMFLVDVDTQERIEL